jgi:hypothetical protein
MNKKSRIIFYSILAAVIAIPLSYLLVVYVQSYRRVAACDSILPKASAYTGEINTSVNKIEEFRKIVGEVKTYKKFDKDPNCLAIIVTYYTNASDSGNARLYYKKLQDMKVTNKQISTWLKLGKTPIEDMGKRIAVIEKNEANNKKNVTYITSEPEKK